MQGTFIIIEFATIELNALNYSKILILILISIVIEVLLFLVAHDIVIILGTHLKVLNFFRGLDKGFYGKYMKFK